MKVGLFRHAEKQTDGTQDPPLSFYGEQQALHLNRWVREGLIPRPDLLYTSPKRRAIQTFSPLARALNISIERFSELDERQSREDMTVFKKRISKFIEGHSPNPERTVYFCSHLDWIEEFCHLAPCDSDLQDLENFSWAPASFLIFDVQTIWHLIEKGQIA
jgi:phosphohistidine phosphatase SixA